MHNTCSLRSRYLLASLVILLLFTVHCYADSLWKEGSSSPYSTHKAFKTGDVITVIILETTTAQHKAGTDTSAKDDLSIQFRHTIQRLRPLMAPDKTHAVTGSGAHTYAGAGGTTRTSKVQAKIAAVVEKILPNGNLIISGNHKMEVNEELQEITLTGVVRPKDVTLYNTVYSYQVADANVSIRGTGTASEAQAPGWITRILNWIF